MDEQIDSNDSDFIDDVMSLLEKEGTVQTEKATNRIGLLIKEPEVIFEDGLSIDDVLHGEVIIPVSLDETNSKQPGTSYQSSFSTDDVLHEEVIIPVSLDETNSKQPATSYQSSFSTDDVLHEEVIISLDETNSNQPGTSYQRDSLEADQSTNMDCSHDNDTNEDATNILSSMDDASNNEDPNDPDFLLSEDEIINVSSGNHPSNIQEDNIENSINANNTLTELANNSQNDLCTVEALNNDNNGERKRNKRPDSSSWDINIHKKLRMTGKKYLGYKRVEVDGKITVKRSETEHEERKMGPVCNSPVCKANKKRKCTEISEEMRLSIFKRFWQLSWKEKKVYISGHVKKTNTQQKTVVGEKTSRRSGSYKYYLSPTTGDLKPVCKLMFLNTLGMKEWMVQNWVSNMGDVSDNEEGQHSEQREIYGATQQDVGEKKGLKEQKKKIISEWFDSLPKVPSHYCRASSSKMYLEPLWDTKVDLYRSYKDFCNSNNKVIGSITTFMQVFECKNLSIFTPKKDQCDQCYAFKAGNVSKEEYDAHIDEKNVARSEKENDKQKAVEGEIYCLTADVESVKLTPMTKASAMYYKMKLNSHNYTVYNLANRHCKCYWFSEVEGDLSANTFASCLIDYLTEHCLSPSRPIVVYTDGCTNQNRNQFVSNALLHFAIQNEVKVTQKYLVKGHTQMEGDSVHARIEKQIRGKDVYMPFEYVKYTKEARQTPFPYEAVYLNHAFFKDFSNIRYYDSVRPGRKKGDPCVVDVRCFQYLPTGKIQFKLSFSGSFEDLPRRPNKIKKEQMPSPLFKERIALPYTKWKHLQELKYIIPEDYHHFYDSLPYKK